MSQWHRSRMDQWANTVRTQCSWELLCRSLTLHFVYYFRCRLRKLQLKNVYKIQPAKVASGSGCVTRHGWNSSAFGGLVGVNVKPWLGLSLSQTQKSSTLIRRVWNEGLCCTYLNALYVWTVCTIHWFSTNCMNFYIFMRLLSLCPRQISVGANKDLDVSKKTKAMDRSSLLTYVSLLTTNSSQ